MGLLTADMKRVVEEQRLGFVATVCPDGTPNLSPKGTTAVWDDEHLVFANIRSPGTLANLRQNANVEVNVVDPFLRKGYRFKGVAAVLESGALYDRGDRLLPAARFPCRARSARSSWCEFKARSRSIRRPTISASPKTRFAASVGAPFSITSRQGRPLRQQANSLGRGTTSGRQPWMTRSKP